MLWDHPCVVRRHNVQILRTARFSIPWIENPRSGPEAGLGNPPGFQPPAQDDNEANPGRPERGEGSVRFVCEQRGTEVSGSGIRAHRFREVTQKAGRRAPRLQTADKARKRKISADEEKISRDFAYFVGIACKMRSLTTKEAGRRAPRLLVFASIIPRTPTGTG